MPPKTQKRPASQRQESTRAQHRLRFPVHGAQGRLKVSLIKQKSPMTLTLVWGMHILQTLYAHTDTKWSDILYILQDASLWDPKDVTELFAYDRHIVGIKVSTSGQKIIDWTNKRQVNKARTVADVGLKDGAVMILMLDRMMS